MNFSELMMLSCSPLFWEGRPHFYAQQLNAFLLYLLDPNKPGVGALRSRNDPEGWKVGPSAVSWVTTTFRTTWLLRADEIHQDNKAAFQAFTDATADIFLDAQRLSTCLDVDVPPETYLGMSIDWSRPGPMLWTPQLRISNYWPHSRDIAPDPPPGLRPPAPMEPDAAASVLEDRFYSDIRARILQLRYRYELYVATLQAGSQRILSPGFYYARPDVMPAQPEDFLSGGGRTGLEQVSRVVLGSHDLLSADVTGAFLEGNLVTFRREVDRDQALQAFYLVVPWCPSEGEWDVEVETEFVNIADQLTFIELDAARAVNQLYPELTRPLVLLGPWGATLDQAAMLARELQRRVAFEPRRRGRKDSFELVRLLRAAVSRIQGAALPATDTILLARAQWQVATEQTIRLARRRVTARPLPRIPSLLDALADSGPYRANQSLVYAISQRAEQLREHLTGIIAGLQDMLEQERREEQDRVERNTRLLGYAVAILAAVTAFPILTGELNWQELRQEVTSWPMLGAALEMLHSWLIIVSMILAGGAIVGLFFLFLYAALPPLIVRQTQFSKIGNKVLRAYQLLEQAEPLFRSLQSVASVAVRDPRLPEPAELVRMRTRLHDLDVQAATLVAEALDWLETAQASQTNTGGRDSSVELEVYKVIIASELFGNRPLTIPVPLTLCLYRKHGATDDLEFERLLNGYGYEDAEIEVIEQQIRAFSQVSRSDFLKNLQSRGITALHVRSLTKNDEHHLHLETAGESAADGVAGARRGDGASNPASLGG